MDFQKGNAIDGAPKTTSFSIHSPFKKESFALGFYFVNDRLGLEQKNQFDVTYAYRVSLGKNKTKHWYQCRFIVV